MNDSDRAGLMIEMASRFGTTKDFEDVVDLTKACDFQVTGGVGGIGVALDFCGGLCEGTGINISCPVLDMA